MEAEEKDALLLRVCERISAFQEKVTANAQEGLLPKLSEESLVSAINVFNKKGGQ